MGIKIPSVKRIAKLLTARFKTSTGQYVMGQLFPPKISAVGGLSDPYRPFRTAEGSKLKAGDVIIGANSRRYLLIDNGVADQGELVFFTFRALELDKQDVLQRAVISVDPITKRTKEELTPLSTIWYADQPLRALEDSFRIPTPQYNFITHYAVQVGDVLGDYEITRVEHQLGIYSFQGRLRGS